MIGFTNLILKKRFKVTQFIIGRLASQGEACLSHFTLWLGSSFVQCSALGSFHLSRSKSGCRTCSSPRKETMLTWASLACRWSEVWRESAGTDGTPGSKPRSRSLSGVEVGGAGTEASRQRAWFIKSHREHCPGTAVIYPHFFLVKCYWLFYTKGSLSWMGCTGIQFTSTFCQLCFFPPCFWSYIWFWERKPFSIWEKKRADGFKEKPSIIGENIWLER